MRCTNLQEMNQHFIPMHDWKVSKQSPLIKEIAQENVTAVFFFFTGVTVGIMQFNKLKSMQHLCYQACGKCPKSTYTIQCQHRAFWSFDFSKNIICNVYI